MLFKILFVKYPNLLKCLVANLLKIPLDSITEFIITNPEVPPEIVGDKFCRLDINMIVDGVRCDLEIQITDEGDYPERSLYYWAREYSLALAEGKKYTDLPRTIIISIVGFEMFDCAEFHSEFHALEVTRHTPLTDKLVMHYFELPKVPKTVTQEDEMILWLSLFNAKTEEELKQIESLEVEIMSEAIVAYRSITASVVLLRKTALRAPDFFPVPDDRFKELARLRERARHNEASALDHARREERKLWQNVVADKDAALADKDAQIAALLSRLNENK